MYKLKLEYRLKELKELVKQGKANKAIIDEIFYIEILLDNVYYID